MDNNKKKVLDKIQKLLALSQNNPSPEEAAAAASMAQELMTKYNITTYMVESASGQIQEESIINGWQKGEYFENLGNKRSSWKNILATGICKINGCKILNLINRNPTTGKKEIFIVPIGTYDDIITSKYLYIYLRNEIERLCHKHNCGYGKTWANNFKLGATQVVIERLELEYKQSLEKIGKELLKECSSTGVGLIHVSNALSKLKEKQNKVDEFMNNMNFTYEKMNSYKYDQYGFLSGMRAGHEINLKNKQLDAGNKLEE